MVIHSFGVPVLFLYCSCTVPPLSLRLVFDCGIAYSVEMCTFAALLI